jgi:mannose-6-phosphate isomerase-like protein (cupin superfamily)
MRIDIKIRSSENPMYTEEELGSTLKALLRGEEVSAEHVQDVDYVMYPAGGSSSPSIHEVEEEIFYIMRGSGTFHLGDKQIEARAGEAVAVPQKTKHWVKNTGNGPLHYLVCSAKL